MDEYNRLYIVTLYSCTLYHQRLDVIPSTHTHNISSQRHTKAWKHSITLLTDLFRKSIIVYVKWFCYIHAGGERKHTHIFYILKLNELKPSVWTRTYTLYHLVTYCRRRVPLLRETAVAIWKLYRAKAHRPDDNSCECGVSFVFETLKHVCFDLYCTTICWRFRVILRSGSFIIPNQNTNTNQMKRFQIEPNRRLSPLSLWVL